MLDTIRNNQRLLQFVLLILILPSFVLVGVQGFNRVNESDTAVAKVGERYISQTEFDNALRQRLDQYRQILGERFDAKQFDNPQARKSLLDQLVFQRVATEESTRMAFATSDEKLRESLMAIPSLQDGGQFNKERYKDLVRAQGLTVAGFEQRLRADLAVETYANTFTASAFLPKATAQSLNNVFDQVRIAQELKFEAAGFASKVTVTDADAEAYYKANPKEFEIPQSVKVEYLVFDQASLQGAITVSDAQAKAFYDQNSARYKVAEQRRASHILINGTSAESKAKAQALLDQVKAKPAEFEALAKANSQDAGSAPNGGDLDFFGPGQMVKPFEEATYKLKKDEISGLVQSQFGFHIIKLTDIRPEQVKPLEQARAEIDAEIKAQKAKEEYAEKAEAFRNAVYENFDSLKPTADKFKLTVRTAEGVTRTPAQPADPRNPAANPLANEKVLLALFGNEVLNNKKNSEAIEIAPSVMVSVRAAQVTPASQKPLADVAAAIKAKLTNERAVKLAKEEGEKQLTAIKSGAAGAFGAEQRIGLSMASTMPASAVRAVMRAPATPLPQYVGVELGAAGYGVYKISKIETTAPAPAPGADPAQAAQQAAALAAQTKQRTDQFARAQAEAEQIALVTALKNRYKVKLFENRLNPKDAAADTKASDVKSDAKK